MSAPVVIPREQALANARRALDVARAQNHADYLAGRMEPPERRALYERLLAEQGRRDAAAQAAA